MYTQRILIDASRYQITQPTGVEVYGNYLIDELLHTAKRNAEIEITLIAPVEKDIPSLPNVDMVVLPGRRFWTLFHLSSWLFKNRDRYDVLFVPSHILPLILPKRSVMTVHDVAWKRFPESYTFMQRAILSFAMWWAKIQKAQLIVPSKATRDDVVSYFRYSNTSIRCIYHGFDIHSFNSSFVDLGPDLLQHYGLVPGKYLMALGRLEVKKNTHKLIEAAHVLPGEMPMVFVGKPGSGYDVVESSMAKYAGKGVRLLGYLNNDTAYTLLKYSAGLVLPSRYEGFGLTLLEAWSLGVPVLCSCDGALGEVGGNAVVYISDIELLSEELLHFARGDHLSMVRRGKERLQRFSWEVCAAETMEVLLKE